MAKKISTNSIRNITEPWSLDDRNNFPYCGASVEEFIKRTLNGKAGEFYYDADTTKYLVFASTENRDLYLSDREEYASLLLGTFDAPANYTAEIHVTTPASNVILSGSKGNYIDFTFDVKSRTGSSTGESVVVTYSFNNGGNVKKVTQVYNAGTSVHFLVDQYLTDGTNSIAIVVTGRNTLVSTMASVTYNVVDLQLTSSLDFSKPVQNSEYFSVPYTLKGAGIKYVDWYIDGVDIEDTDTIPDLQVNRTKNIDISSLTEGKHNLQVRAYITNNGNNYYSKTLYFDFVVSPTGGVFSTNQTYVLLGLVIDSPVTSTLSVTVTQYEEFNYKASVFDSRNRDLSLIITDNGTQVQSISASSETIQSLTYMPVTTGLHTIGFTADEATASLGITVQDSGLGIDEVTEDLALKLSAKGRSNNETNPAIWTSGSIETTFNNFAWNDKCGWNNGSLIIPAGSSIDINYAPLSGVPVQNGRTFEIDFETVDIEDENADILSLINTNTNAGITIKPNTAKFQSAGGTNINTRFRDGDRLHLTFIVNKTTGDDARFMYIVNNGIVERAARFAATDNFNVSTLLHIGSAGCTIKLHSIKVYNKALTVDEAFQNYAIDSNNIVEVVNNNDILNDSTGLIDADKVNAKIPIMIITGNISSILSISDKAHKNDWNTYPVDIEYRNMQNPEFNFFIDDADIRLQGTSSISYPRKNFRIYSKSKSKKYATKLYSPTHEEEDLVANGKYAFKENAAPVTCWCLKADYAESSGSHNVGVAKLWNSVMKNTNNNGNYILRTNAQTWAATNEYPYDVRTTIDGFPIVLFQRDNENAPLVCLGQYNFNNDKSTEDVFGFTALSKEGVTPFDNSNVECWEVLDSDNSIALFTDVSNFDSGWEDAFEARHLKENGTVAALKTVCQFVNSCYDSANDTVDVAAWRAGKASHFDLNKLAAYYIYLLRFGAVDQTVKNAMFTTEDGVHWFYINYDNDTILGIDNESHQFDTWDYGLFTQTPQGGYYYAGKGKSVLWRLFEADSECMTLARQIDALLFNAGLTYEAVCAMFDNEQSGQWCERIYNENGRYKYITQAIEGKNVLHMLQGSRKSHRHWWLQHRFEKYDNVFGNGTYSIRSIQARATGTVNIPKGAAYKFTPAITTYFGYAVASTTVDPPTERTAGEVYTATGLPQDTGVGNLIYIYNANNIGAIDLSAYISALGSLNIGDAKDVNGNSRLTKLVLGDGTNTNAYLTAISGLQDIISIEELDIRGYQAITSMELATLTNLNTFKAENSGLTSFVPAAGTILNSISLPATLQSLVLDNNNVNTLSYTPTKTLNNVTLKKVSGNWDKKSFVNGWLVLFNDSELSNVSLTLSGINWTNMTAAQAITMGKVGTKNYLGKITLTSLSESEYNQLVELYGPNVFNPNSKFIIDAPANVLLSGPSEIKEGNSGTFTAAAFPVTENAIKYLLYNGTTLINAQTDGQGRVYRTYNGVTLYEATGIMNVVSGLTGDVAVKVRAQVSNTEIYSSYINVTGKKITYPSSVNISGNSPINQNGTYNYTKAFDTNNFNAQITNVAWSLTSNNASNLYASDDNSATILVTNTPATSIQVTLTCVVTFEGGVTRTGTKGIAMVLTFPSSISISGVSSIDDNGDYEYTKTINGSYTATLTNVAWSLTANENIAIDSANENKAVVKADKGNDTAVTLTLSCICTFSGGVTRTGTKDIAVSVFDAPPTEEWVDLGLPSGLLWCTHNVGTTNPEDAGLYFAWGETTGYVDAADRNTKLGRSDGFSSDAYTSTGGAAITDSVLTLEHDAAQVNMGFDWRMPTDVEFAELINNCSTAQITIKGTLCLEFTSNINGNKVIFPEIHYCKDNIFDAEGRSDYFSSTKVDNNYAKYMYVTNALAKQGTYGDRRYGYNIRAVREPVPEMVDLGLPSGNLWTDRNIGAKRETDLGDYFSWGNIVGHTSTDGSTFDDSYNFGDSNSGPYASTPGANLSTDIPNNDVAHDAALAILGNGYHLPTKDEFQELYDNTDREWTSIDGVNGWKFMKKTNHNVYVFFPAAGSGFRTSLSNYGLSGYYWSSSRYNSDLSYSLNFGSGSVARPDGNYRYSGFSIRAVCPAPIITSYRIDQTNPDADPSDVIIKTIASKDASADTDAIAAIRANSHIYVGRYDSTNNVLNARQVSDSDKTLWTDGTSIVMGAEDDVFMKLPAFKWKCEEVSTDIYEITFAYGVVSGSGWHEWEGNTFIGVYEAYQDNNKIYSKSGVTPTVNVSWTDFTAQARARYNNNNYRIVTYEAHQIMCLLGYGWLSTTDAQAVIGVGNSTLPKTTGLCDSKGMSDSVKSVDGDTTSINFWGLENWWGDIYEWIDNIKSSGSYKVNILGDDRTTVVRSNIGSGNNVSGEIKQLVLGTEGEVIPKLTASNSNYNKNFADDGKVDLGSGKVARRSSNAASLAGGLACLFVNYDVSGTKASVGSRLLYKGNYNIVSSLT